MDVSIWNQLWPVLVSIILIFIVSFAIVIAKEIIANYRDKKAEQSWQNYYEYLQKHKNDSSKE